jgi:hypothetical protein
MEWPQGILLYRYRKRTIAIPFRPRKGVKDNVELHSNGRYVFICNAITFP